MRNPKAVVTCLTSLPIAAEGTVPTKLILTLLSTIPLLTSVDDTVSCTAEREPMLIAIMQLLRTEGR